MMESLVEELALVAEEVLVTADDGLLSEFHVEVPLLLVREANAVLARLVLLLGLLRDDIDLLVHFIIFLKDVLLGRIEARFQGLKH